MLLEGNRYRAQRGISQPPRCDFGIYSIRQRTLSDLAKRRLSTVATTTTNTTTPPTTQTPVMMSSSSDATAAARGIRKISEKVDTLHLHDEDGDDRKNDNVQAGGAKATYTTPSAPSPVSSPHTNKNPSKIILSPRRQAQELRASPTQGDTLNQIKAMRRRHSRSVNVSASL